MEPVSLTLGAIAASLVAKAVEKATDRAVSDGARGLGRLVGWLRERLGGDSPGSEALARVEDAPDSPSRVRQLADVLDQRAATDEQFRAALEQMVAEAGGTSVELGPVTQTAWGNQNVQSAGVTNSTISISQGEQRPGPG